MAESRHPDRLINEQSVAECYGISVRSVHRWWKLGKIPAPVANRPNFVRWSENEIQADIAAMRDAARQEAMT